MIALKAYYEFENETNIRRHYYKSVFERSLEEDNVCDLDYDAPDAEAYIDIASKFGLDVNLEASEIVWDAIYDEISNYIDQALIELAFEHIKEENLVCYKVGLCSDDSITFETKDLFCYSDSGFLYCILKSRGDKDADKFKAQHTAVYLTELYDDIVVYKEAIQIEKHIENYASELDASPAGYQKTPEYIC